VLPDLDLGILTVHSYGLLVGLGVLLTYLVVRHEAGRVGLEGLKARLEVLGLWLALAAFVGGKLVFLVLYPEKAARYAHEGFGTALRKGFAFQGSLVVCVLTAMVFFRRCRLPVLKSMDALSLGIPVLHLMGRLGCFCAGCCYGSRADGPLTVVFDRGCGLNGVSLHPVQLYEALGEAAIFLILWLGLRHRLRRAGDMVLSYILMYSALRFGTEFLRGDGNPVLWGAHTHAPGAPPVGVTVDQGIALLLFGICAALLVFRGRHRGGRQASRTGASHHTGTGPPDQTPRRPGRE
jgi:phosphatidylglycerol:prolipoprotein diacylglycerol transferase